MVSYSYHENYTFAKNTVSPSNKYHVIPKCTTPTTATANGGTTNLFVASLVLCHPALENQFNRRNSARATLAQTAFPAQTRFLPRGDGRGACIFMMDACIVMLQLQTREACKTAKPC